MPRNALYPASSHEARYPIHGYLDLQASTHSTYRGHCRVPPPSQWNSAPILGNDSLVILMGSLVRFDLEASSLSCLSFLIASTEMSCPGFSAEQCITLSPR
ncbi:hypothetical protein LB503_011202 [Fusarium chuoi]|nr:hypothetical protein LB503_011202 [Fusarium chuoi]